MSNQVRNSRGIGIIGILILVQIALLVAASTGWITVAAWIVWLPTILIGGIFGVLGMFVLIGLILAIAFSR